MRIVQVTPAYPPSTGGVEAHVQSISTRLVDRGHKVTVVSTDAVSSDDSETNDGVTVKRCRSVSPHGNYHFSPTIINTIHKLDVDILHVHNYHSLIPLAAAVGSNDARFIFTPHYHGGSDSTFRDLLLKIYEPIGRQLLQQADEVIAVSKWESNQLMLDFGVDARIIPNGIEVERFLGANPYYHRKSYLLSVGRIEEYKGVQHAIRAMSELPEYDLLIAGNGPYREKLEQIAKKEGVDERVVFLGYVPNDELPRLYAGATVFLTLSSFEAFGITVGEAIASGTSCVVRRRGALVDWEQYNGVVGVEEISPKSIAKGVRKAQTQSVIPSSVPQWSEHLDQLVNLYRSE